MTTKGNDFYKSYIEKEDNLKIIFEIILSDISFVFDGFEEALFEEGELNVRKNLKLKRNECIEKIKRKLIKEYVKNEVEKKEWNLMSKLETEIKVCGDNAKKYLSENDSIEQQKLNIRLKELSKKKPYPEMDLGRIIKEALQSILEIIETIRIEAVGYLGREALTKWSKKYVENIREANKKLIEKGVFPIISDDEIFKNHPLYFPREENKKEWNFRKKINELYKDTHHHEMEYGINGIKSVDSKKDIYEMLSEMLLVQKEYVELTRDKRLVTPKSFIKNITEQQNSNENKYGFGAVRDAFKNETIPLKNISVLKMIADMFERIIEEENIIPESKVLLCKLQFPVIKTSLLNTEMIIKDDSVVNETLKKITEELKLINTAESHFFSKIKEIVLSFTNIDFSQESEDFIKESWEKLGKEIEGNQKKSLLIESRNKERELGGYFYKVAQEDVSKEISSTMLDAEYLGKIEKDFIEKEIKNNLMICKLRDLKNETNDFEINKVIFELWFDALFITRKENEAKKYTHKIFSMLKENNSSNESIYKDQLKKIFFNNIKTKKEAKESEKQEFQKEKYEEYKIIFNKEREKKKPISDVIITAIKNLQYGDWIEVGKEDGVIQNCKLLLKLNNDNKYIFVGSDGNKNLTIDIDELSELYKNKKVKIMDKNSVMERALEKIFKK